MHRTEEKPKFNYDNAIYRAIFLDKQREQAYLDKKKREVIDNALLLAEQKTKTIQELINSKEMKRNFEASFAQNKFGLPYQYNPQIQNGQQRRAVSQQPITIPTYQMNPYNYYQNHYQQQQQYQTQLEQQRVYEQKQKSMQEALDQIKLMQLEPMRQLKELQAIEEKLVGPTPKPDPYQFYNTMGGRPPLYQQSFSPQKPIVRESIQNQSTVLKQAGNLLIQEQYTDPPQQNYINVQRPSSQNQPIRQPQPEAIEGDYMDRYLNSKYHPNQHRDPNVRLLSDAKTLNLQEQDARLLDERKRKLVLEFQNLRKRHAYNSKVNQEAIMSGIQQHNAQVVQQESDIQTALAAQQQLIMQLINGMNLKKEDEVKIKNQELLKKIKKIERKNKRMKNQVNKTLMLQLGGREEIIPYDQLLVQTESEDEDSDLDG